MRFTADITLSELRITERRITFFEKIAAIESIEGGATDALVTLSENFCVAAGDKVHLLGADICPETSSTTEYTVSATDLRAKQFRAGVDASTHGQGVKGYAAVYRSTVPSVSAKIYKKRTIESDHICGDGLTAIGPGIFKITNAPSNLGRLDRITVDGVERAIRGVRYVTEKCVQNAIICVAGNVTVVSTPAWSAHALSTRESRGDFVQNIPNRRDTSGVNLFFPALEGTYLYEIEVLQSGALLAEIIGTLKYV